MAITDKTFQHLGLFATNFLEQKVVVFLGVLLLFESAQEFQGFGPSGGFIHAVEAAPHHEFHQVAFATALEAAVTPVTQGVVEEQGGLFGSVERTTGNQVPAPPAEGNSQLTGVGLYMYKA